MISELDLRAREQMEQIGRRISALRGIKRISQEVLAERAKISSVELSLIESPAVYNVFSMEVFYNICTALEISPSALISGEIVVDGEVK
ncbi:MAG: helix-turn-helix transcriptional regulator [Ruminococcaceae bacterium]|nr:helix-turn-helix transcriptional regulator [Oscillospiraceae bacterium]